VAKVLPAGSWVDVNGDLHVSVPDILAAVGLPHTPENEDIAVRVLRELLAEYVPGAEVVVRKAADLPGCDPARDPLRPLPPGVTKPEAGVWEFN
jgi:hypothetical protein